MDDKQIALASVFLRNMPPPIADELVEKSITGRCSEGEVLFREGDPAKHVYVVTEGMMKLSRISRQGNEAVVSIQERGDSIATALAFSDNVYPVSCTALKDSKYVGVSSDTVRDVLLGSKEAIGSVLAATFAHLHELVDQVALLKASTTQKRVACFLVIQCGDTAGQANFRLPYDKAVIAGVLGMTPESLSRAFSKLRDHGVHMDGKNVTIEDVDALRGFLEDG